MSGPVANPWLAQVRPNPLAGENIGTLTLNVLLGYFDTIERLVIRDCPIGGLARDLIISGDLDTFSPSVKHLIIRQEWLRTNAMTPSLTSFSNPRLDLPTVTGDEIIAESMTFVLTRRLKQNIGKSRDSFAYPLYVDIWFRRTVGGLLTLADANKQVSCVYPVG